MNAPIDFNALKTRQQAAWASGDYAVIGTTLQIVGEQLAEACDLRWDERVLDVAAGNGNATLAAARRGCKVVSTDYVESLLERGAERARAERLDVEFKVADVEALPFRDASFDAVLSTFGVMFTPDHARSAAEMARVCRSGGRIGVANWTPGGFIGQLFRTLGRHLPPPAGAQPPALLGSEAHLHSLFEGSRREDRRDAAHLQLPLSLGRALHRHLPHLVRAGAQGLRRPGPREGRGAGARPDRAAERPQSRRQGFAGRTERVPGDRRHAPLRLGPAPRLLECRMATGPFFAKQAPGPASSACTRTRALRANGAALVDMLAPKFHVLAADSYGAGKSPPWPADRQLVLRDEVALLEPVFARAGNRFTLVGHSYGAAIALIAAVSQPGRVHALALYEPTLFSLVDAESPPPNDADGIKNAVIAAAAYLDAGDPDRAAEQFIDFWMGKGAWAGTPAPRKPPIAAAVANITGWAHALMKEPTPLAAFRALKIPVLYMTGSDSPASSRGVARILTRALPQVEVVEFKGLGHMAPVIHPQPINEAIARFLERV